LNVVVARLPCEWKKSSSDTSLTGGRFGRGRYELWRKYILWLPTYKIGLILPRHVSPAHTKAKALTAQGTRTILELDRAFHTTRMMLYRKSSLKQARILCRGPFEPLLQVRYIANSRARLTPPPGLLPQEEPRHHLKRTPERGALSFPVPRGPWRSSCWTG
jgi:hypothetical protein